MSYREVIQLAIVVPSQKVLTLRTYFTKKLEDLLEELSELGGEFLHHSSHGRDGVCTLHGAAHVPDQVFADDGTEVGLVKQS